MNDAVVVQDSIAQANGKMVVSNPTLPLHIIIITHSEAKTFISRHHYLGIKPFRSSVSFGLLHNNELVGVAAYHNISAPETAVGAFGLQRCEQRGLWELDRLALRPDHNGGNNGSFFIRRSIMLLGKQRDVRAVIAYADSGLHVGSIYQAAGFIYCGLTTQKSDFYVNGKIKERGKTKGIGGEWRLRPRKHRYIVLIDKAIILKWIVLQYPKKINVDKRI
ncbi:MAG: hypothetical protein IMZ43_09595 [Thermoplasmata archaeon]|nr:hypothetical protein [Thermoplasmata archaeon]